MPRRSGRSCARSLVLESLEERALLTYATPGAPFDLGAGLADGTEFRSAVDDRGRVTVVWDAPGAGGDLDVFARRYDSGGSPLGPAFLVNAGATAGDQITPRISATPSGGFVVCWWSDSQVYFQRYDRGGVPQGSAQPLGGTQGFSQEFEVFGYDATGFVVYGDGFQFRWYDLGGTLTRSESDAGITAQKGWTIIEPDDPARAVRLSSYQLLVTWSVIKPRTVGSDTVYDAQIRSMVIGPYAPSAAYLLLDEVGLTDASLAENLSPRIVTASSPLVVWRDVDADGHPEFKSRTYTNESGSTEVGFYDGVGDAVPTAIESLNTTTIAVHYARSGSSYVRIWKSGDPWNPSTGSPWVWQLNGDPIPVDAPASGGYDSVRIVPTVGQEFWTLWSDASASPGLHARRFFTTDAPEFHFAFGARPAGASPGVLTVGEADGVAAIAVYRTGDLSSTATIRYSTRAGTAAVPGYDYTPVSGVLTFPPGRSDAILLVPIINDSVPTGYVDPGDTFPNGQKVFSVDFSDPQGAAMLDNPTLDVRILDDDPYSAYDLSFFDFGPSGIWTWNEVKGWAHISTRDPVAMLATPDRSLFADFGADGLWIWDGRRGWRKLNDQAPEAMVYGTGKVLYADYGSGGLWRWSDAGGWVRISTLNPVKMATTASVGLYVDFGAQGVQRWAPGAGLRLVQPTSPEAMVVDGDDLVADYGAAGLWRYGLSGASWTKLDPRDPRSIAAGPIGVVVDFGDGNLWRATASGLAFLHGGELVGAAFGEDVGFAVVQNGSGFVPGQLWTWNSSNVWSKINDLAPSRFFASTQAGDLIADYGPNGLWDWSLSTGWRKINWVTPQAVARM
ncbi:Calx-beta domain-containing protein [Paludisphaera rhizosphaerae]|uniref:Calx-beta domain-containing protein n=1 Tax=Paludisphaera rhizosphaerae TaxID=2711216 RepID=UPI0013ED055C|nr:Calx-beta domain-containing protein [Paludisphaera rhizosphaerae]